jgi:hypothetical protein
LIYFTPSNILDNLEPPFHPKLKATIMAMQDIQAENLSFTLANVQQTRSMVITKGKSYLVKGKSYEYELPYDETFMKSARGGGINVGALVTYYKKNSETNRKPVLVNGTFSTGLKEIDYPHIPFIHYFHGTGATVIGEQVKVRSKRIGYIMGAGDKVPSCLELMGMEVTILRQQDLFAGDLSRYDAIVTGVRAFNTQTWLADVMPKLMTYVKGGGVLVEQYNNYNGLVTPELGPYPFHVGGGRVTDETADVQFLDPANSVLHYPNEITNEDFAAWIQERGLYYVDVPDGLDDHYKTVLGMKDKGEDNVQKGSLITAAYGKGRFVYTSLAFFRELPAGVPGAYRLFANLLAKPPAQ